MSKRPRRKGTDLRPKLEDSEAMCESLLPADLWDCIFASDTDVAALCFTLNSSFNRIAQAFLLGHKILPLSLKNLMEDEDAPFPVLGDTCLETVECFAKELAEELLLEPCVVLDKLSENRIPRPLCSCLWDLLDENGGLGGLQGRIARERRKASYMQMCQGTSPADATEKLKRGLKVLGLNNKTFIDPWKTIEECKQQDDAIDAIDEAEANIDQETTDMMEEHQCMSESGMASPYQLEMCSQWRERALEELAENTYNQSRKIGLAMVRNNSEMCKEYIESGGTRVSLENLLQAMAHTNYLLYPEQGEYEVELDEHAHILCDGWRSQRPNNWVEAAEAVRVNYVRFRLPVTLEPWLAAGKFASTHDALAAAFTQADPEESARRLKLREYRAARELQFEKSTCHSGSHSV